LRRQRTQQNVTVGTQYYYYADSRRIGDVSNDPDDNARVSYAEELGKRDLKALLPVGEQMSTIA
jgi:hypothetical protein